MLLENVKAYTTSKNNIEVILSGEYTTTGKILNNRQKYEDENGKVFWVPCEQTGEDKTESFFEQISNNTQNVNSGFFSAITTTTTQDKDDIVAAITSTTVEEQHTLYHTVQRGDTIESIAAQYNVPVAQIDKMRNNLYIGKKIRVR